MRRRERECARRRSRVAIGLRERLGGLAIGGHPGRETNPHRSTRRQPDALAQAEDRIEHESGCSGQCSTIEGDRVLGGAAAADEAGAIGLPFDRPVRAAFEAEDVDGPGARIAAIARAAMTDQRAPVRQEFGLDEKFSKCRVREVVARLRQRHFDVTGDVDFAHPLAVIDQLQQAYLDIVFGGDRDFELGRDLLVLALEGRGVGQEGRGVRRRLTPRRVIGRRPDFATANIPQVDERTAGVERGIAPRACHAEPLEHAGAAAGIGDRHRVLAVGQKLRMRKAGLRRSIAADRHADALGRRKALVVGPRLAYRLLTWHALLQQAFGGAHPRVGVEALDHAIAGQGVGDCDERHARVMREDRAHHHAVGKQAAAPGALAVIDRFVEAVIAEQLEVGQPAKIFGAARRIDQHRQRRGIGRDDELVTEAAFEAESRHAERLVLIGAVPVGSGVGRFGHAPRRAARRRVIDLPPDRHPAGFIEQCFGKAAHHEQRHQVLEHRGAPRQQHRRSMHGADQPAEMEPVQFGHVALGDGDEAGQPRLGREQIVERVIHARRGGAVGEAIADRKQVAFAVVEEPEVHFIEISGGAPRQRLQTLRQAPALVGGVLLRGHLSQSGRQHHQRRREITAVDGRDVAGWQRRERLRVVPIQQVALEMFEAIDRR